jgi:hypothetical protein
MITKETKEGLPIINQDSPTDKFAPTSFEDVFKLWSKHEDTAIHFNDLLIKLRIQILGGVSISGTLAATIEKNSHSLKYIFVSFWVIWGAVWILDAFYYSRLLSGAVDATIDIEREFPGFQLSTKIKKSVNQNLKKVGGGVHIFYLIIFICLFVTSALIWRSN